MSTDVGIKSAIACAMFFGYSLKSKWPVELSDSICVEHGIRCLRGFKRPCSDSVNAGRKGPRKRGMTEEFCSACLTGLEGNTLCKT